MSRSENVRAALAVMEDGGWHYLPHLASAVGLSQTGCSARIRDLRKKPLCLARNATPPLFRDVLISMATTCPPNPSDDGRASARPVNHVVGQTLPEKDHV